MRCVHNVCGGLKQISAMETSRNKPRQFVCDTTGVQRWGHWLVGYVCFENRGRFTKACACELLPTGLVKFRNLVASKLSLWVFHLLSPPAFSWENSYGVFGCVTCVDHLVLLAWGRLLVINMGDFCSPTVLYFTEELCCSKAVLCCI